MVEKTEVTVVGKKIVKIEVATVNLEKTKGIVVGKEIEKIQETAVDLVK